MRRWRNEADMFIPVCFDDDRHRAYRLLRRRASGVRGHAGLDSGALFERRSFGRRSRRGLHRGHQEKLPRMRGCYVQRGVAWSQTGDYDYAIGDFSKAIRLDPRNALAFYNLGIAREKKGELQESLVDFKRYAELRPLDPDARTAIERVTDALAAKTAPRTASAAIAEHFGDPSVAQIETMREPETPAPKAANSARDDFLLLLPALFLIAGVTAVAMLMRKGGDRTADAHRLPDNLETEPVVAGEVGSNIEPDPPKAWYWSEFKSELDEGSNRRILSPREPRS